MKLRIKLIFSVLFISTLFSACCLKHDWKEATCSEPRLCVKCGKTEGTALGHTWTAATCEAPKTCPVCGETEGAALGHHFLPATCTEAPTCAICAKKEGLATGHIWLDASCERAKTCATCHAEEGLPLGHAWQEATCALPKTCRSCGKTDGDPITIEEDLLNHEDRANILVNVVRGQVSAYPTVYKDFFIELENNDVHYIFYYQDALIPNFKELREKMLLLDWPSLVQSEAYAFSQLYGVYPDAVDITYMLGDEVLFSTFELYGE